ncbi:MAG: MATE family efflux transporter, partial [Pseudomonadota bacterium]
HKSLWFIWIGMVLNVCFINLPIFVLPQIASTHEIGLFGVSFRLVMLSTTILVSLSALFGPHFVKYYQQNDTKNLKQELQQSQWYSLIAYSPFFIIFTLFPESVLTLFGNEFKQATSILIILALAQLVNSATGLVGYFLIMIEHEKIELITLIITLAITLPLMFILGNSYGVIGVTLAYAIGISLKNILSLCLAYYFIKQIK